MQNVVPDEEYKANIELLIKSYPDKLFILIDTIPNKALWRNDEIVRYNKILENISVRYKNVLYLKIYDIFFKKFDFYYIDKTHINNAGYEFISSQLAESHKNYKNIL